MNDSIFPPGVEPTLPILPLRNSVLFPASVVPVNVGRPRSVRLIEEACNIDRPLIGVVAQRRSDTADPTFSEIHPVGTIARILKVIRLSSGAYSVVLQGVSRMRLLELVSRRPFLRGRVQRIHEQPATDPEIEALAAQLREMARDIASRLPGRREGAPFLDNVREPGSLADVVASNLPVSNDSKQAILETLDIRLRVRKVLELVSRQTQVYQVKEEISTMVRDEMSRSQREILLRQQLRQIKRELGEPDDEDDVEALRERVAKADMPAEAEKAARKQLGRMTTMSSASAEYQVAQTYVEWLLDLPWSKAGADRLDVTEARRVLDEDHHGLERAKKRILEYIAVRRLRSDLRGPILCFVGPPGVGKTSLSRSIARATGREFVRISLGGVQDEAEVRGHRRTYVGAFPGRIISGLKKAGTKNPVMTLDEIDKLASDSRGDPGSALLEVLDPEQNKAFADHYIEVPVDLSQVLFIGTANRRDTIPTALLDRMEVIEIPGYTRLEKMAIARDFIIPRQLADHGLTPERLELTSEAIGTVVDDYTHEAGVRRLEQQVATLCRAVAVRLAQGEDVRAQGTPDFVTKTLGPPRGSRQKREQEPRAGLCTGLAWTPAGGDLLLVEATRMPGAGRIHLTGSMGKIMQESATAAVTYVRSHCDALGLPADFLSKIDIHVHLPAGAIPKDGAAAGITVLVALMSLLTRRRVRTDMAMSGEVTLRGNILKVGGVKEKCLAAHRASIRHVILPRRNEADLEEIPEEVRRDLEIHLVSHAEEVSRLVLLDDEPQQAAATAP